MIRGPMARPSGSAFLSLMLCSTALAQTSADKAVSVLRQNCAACHGAGLKMSGLDLRTRESILAGGEHGPAVDPGNPEKSRLYRFVAGLENPTMPPGKKLPDEQIAVLREWIEEGAPMPEAAASPKEKDEEARPRSRRWKSGRSLPEERQVLGVSRARSSRPFPSAHAIRSTRFSATPCRQGTEAFARRRSADPDPSRLSRHDRPAAHARAGERVPE